MLDQKVRAASWHRKLPLSTTRNFGLKSLRRYKRQQFVAMITLDFNDSILDGAASPAQLLELAGHLLEVFLCQGQA